MSRLLGALLICLTIGLAGCAGKSSARQEVVEVISTPVSAPTETKLGPPLAPISPVQVPNSPMPTPTPSLSTSTPPSLVLPAPSSGLGVVYGRIVQPNGSPIGDAPVRLGTIVWSEGQEGKEGVVLAERATAPQTVSDTWGRFVITDVSPETYGLAVHDLSSDGVIFVPGELGDTILQVEVEADSTVDLGEIVVPFPTLQ